MYERFYRLNNRINISTNKINNSSIHFKYNPINKSNKSKNSLFDNKIRNNNHNPGNKFFFYSYNY